MLWPGGQMSNEGNTALVPGRPFVSVEQDVIWFFRGPKVHSPERFSLPSPWRGRGKCCPRHLTNALTLAVLLQGGI